MDYNFMDFNEDSSSSVSDDNSFASMDDASYCDDGESLSDWSENAAFSDGEDSNFREQLKDIFDKCNVPQATGTKILKLIRQHPCFSHLPADHRTLMNTPQQKIILKQVAPGQYLHIGVEKTIVDHLRNVDKSLIPNVLKLDISTDGANLDRTGYVSIWPIQGKFANIPNSTPLIFGVYKGRKKPNSADEFLEDFINEFNEIIRKGGIEFDTKKKSLELHSFIADAPARAFILNHKGHTGHNNCSKCAEDGTPRTDKDYRNRTDEEHHHGPTPLARLPLDLVKQVSFDWMHSTLLGAVKRQTWATVGSNHNFSKDVKLSAVEIGIVNARLSIISDFVPREFSRRSQNITDYKRMKATEFRQLILYTGPVIYYGIYKTIAYEHYLLHHSALRCLVAPQPSTFHLEYAKVTLDTWESTTPRIYGENFPSYNIHAQKHLVEDVKNLGSLDTISAFPYENNMSFFRKICRKPHLPLQQISRRLMEKSTCGAKLSRNIQVNSVINPSQIQNGGLLPHDFRRPNTSQYKLINTGKFSLGINIRDNCCILNDSSICIIRNVLVHHDNGNEKDYSLVVNKFKIIESWFDAGIESSVIGSFKCSNLNANLECIELNQVAAKCYRMPYWPLPTCNEIPSVEPQPDTYIITVMLN